MPRLPPVASVGIETATASSMLVTETATEMASATLVTGTATGFPTHGTGTGMATASATLVTAVPT